MNLLKTVFKLLFVLVLGVVVIGAVYIVRRPKDKSPVSYDQWPSVPRNPEA